MSVSFSNCICIKQCYFSKVWLKNSYSSGSLTQKWSSINSCSNKLGYVVLETFKFVANGFIIRVVIYNRQTRFTDISAYALNE